MKKSIRNRMILIIATIIGGVLFFAWLLNITFAEEYYVASEKEVITSSFEEVKKYLTEDESLITLNEHLEQLSNRTNVKMMIAESSPFYFDQLVVFSNMSDGTKTYQQILDYLEQIRNQVIMNQNILEEENDDQPQWYLHSMDENLSTLISKGYYITQIKDKFSGQNGIYLFGFTENDYLIAMRVSIEGIRTSVQISSRFIAYISMIAVFLGVVITSLYAWSFTRPIKEMAEVANRMTNLDFDAKVTNLTEDELGELGKSINQLSCTLEGTIADLKTANLELQQDIKEKEEVDEMRKEFLSHVTHELKTPIAIIQGYAEGLKEGIIDDQESMDFYCDVIMDEANRMNQMVRKLLTLNQFEFGKEPIQITRFDLRELIQNKMEATKILSNEKNVSIHFDETEPVYVWADDYMIEEVFNNYLTNAIHHVTTEGEIRVWFERTQKTIRTNVYNEGKTIPEEELEKLWIKFYKVDKARTREYGGNGIGLSIVAAAMHAHQKEFGVKNVENGVVFYFDLDTVPNEG